MGTRQAAFDEASLTSLQTLRALQQQMEIVQGNTFEEFRQNTRGNPWVQWHRALDPKWDRNLETQFQVSQTSQMATIAQQMSLTLSQLRQSNPIVDEAMKNIMDVEHKRATQAAKIASSAAFANMAIGEMERNGTLPADPAAVEKMRQQFQASLMEFKSPDEILQTQLANEKALMSMWLQPSDVDRYGEALAPVVKRRLIEQAKEERENPATSLQADNLLRKYSQYEAFELKLLTSPLSGVPTVVRHEMSGRSEKVLEDANLEPTTSIVRAARLLALARFREYIASVFGEGKVAGAVSKLQLPETEEDLAGALGDGLMSPELYQKIRSGAREDGLAEMEANVQQQLDVRF